MHNVIDLILTDIVWLFVRRLNLQKENDLNRKERTFLDVIVPYLDVYTHTHTKCVVSMNKYCLRKLQRKISDYYECIWQVTCVKMTSFVYDISHCSMWRKLVSFLFKDLPNGYWLIVSVSVCFHFLLCSDFIDWRCHKFDKNSMMHITSRFRLEFHLLLEKTHGNDMANKIHRFDYHALNWYHIWMHLFVCEDYWPLTFHELVLHVWMIVGRKKSVGIGFFPHIQINEMKYVENPFIDCSVNWPK